MSIPSFHPESWSPSWSISTILLGFQSFFYCQEQGIGVLYRTAEGAIRRMTAQSMEFNKRDKEFCALFPYLLSLEEETVNVATKRKAMHELIKPEKQYTKNDPRHMKLKIYIFKANIDSLLCHIGPTTVSTWAPWKRVVSVPLIRERNHPDF